MDSVSEARLNSGVLPQLAAKIRQLADAMAANNNRIRVVQALRSWNQQDALYAQGRTTVPLGKVVTNARGGYSYHNFGLAVDCVPSINGLDAPQWLPDWNIAHPTWQEMIRIGQSLGLACGATWRSFPDFPHFQLTGRFPESAPDDEVRQLFTDGGTQAVWDEVIRSLT